MQQQQHMVTCVSCICMCEQLLTITRCTACRCIPEVLQYSCMEPMYSKPVNVSSADSSRLFYIFADSLRTKEFTARCGAGQLIKIKAAELGAGVFSSDVTNQIISQCSATSNTCKVDITKLSGTAGKALRVEYVCACAGTSGGCAQCSCTSAHQWQVAPANETLLVLAGAQPMPAPGGDPVFGQCLPCPAGTYRGEFEIDCMPCPAGTASNATGVVSRSACWPVLLQLLLCQLPACRASEHACAIPAWLQQTTCPPCPAGTASTEKGALACRCVWECLPNLAIAFGLCLPRT